MKIIKHNGGYLLIDDDMNREARTLPVGTVVFCIGEIYSGYPEVRHSTTNDHCNGCQPIVGSTKDLGLATDKVEAVVKIIGIDIIDSHRNSAEYIDGDAIVRDALTKELERIKDWINDDPNDLVGNNHLKEKIVRIEDFIRNLDEVNGNTKL
jgi:hypothetical protein